MIELNGTTIPVRCWFGNGVPVDTNTEDQIRQTSQIPIVAPAMAVMPDAHLGRGGTVGSVIPTRRGIIPGTVGVDLGCTVTAIKTSLTSEDVGKSKLERICDQIHRDVPVGTAARKGKGNGNQEVGIWADTIPQIAVDEWDTLKEEYDRITTKHPGAKNRRTVVQMGTLGSGNHFIEMNTDQNGDVWVLIHSGSRGVGNAIGTYFITLAKEKMGDAIDELPNRDLAYFLEDNPLFHDYIDAVLWAQNFSKANHRVMTELVLSAIKRHVKKFTVQGEVITCQHNYVSKETHFGEDLWVTRKGAVRARKDEMVVIPGSMNTKTHIARGLGNELSLESCSHGAGRKLPRGQAKKKFDMDEVRRQTKGLVCKASIAIADELPGAYKDISSIMLAQSDLCESVFTLTPILNVKGE